MESPLLGFSGGLWMWEAGPEQCSPLLTYPLLKCREGFVRPLVHADEMIACCRANLSSFLVKCFPTSAMFNTGISVDGI